MLGFDISERTVLNWMRRTPRDPRPAKRWATFLANHREAIAAMDFFTVSTLTFGVLYGFFVIAHGRRQVLHFNVTPHPTSAWVSQQLRDAFPFDSAPRYLIFDRGSSFNDDIVEMIKSFGVEPKRTNFQSPWQNGVAERFVGSCRRDLLDHVIVLNERHLKWLMTEYVSYYHDDRTHLGLTKQTPVGRAIAVSTAISAKIISVPRIGGLHHRYTSRLKDSYNPASMLMSIDPTGVPTTCLCVSTSSLPSPSKQVPFQPRELRTAENLTDWSFL
jgi:transposase InsO family protein